MISNRLSRIIQAYKLDNKNRRRIWTSIAGLGLAISCIVALLFLAPGLADDGIDECLIPEHTHDESCYLVLICEEEEGEHIHSTDCQPEPALICELEEDYGHIHGEDCINSGESVLICGLEEDEGYVHSEDCYGEPELICELHEIHNHDVSCYDPQGREYVKEYICDIEDEDHDCDANFEYCYRDLQPVCGIPEVHYHGDECYGEPVLLCEEVEREGHAHGPDCYEAPEYICEEEEERPQGHIHTEDCYEGTAVECEETGHIHGEDCYIISEVPACGIEEHEHSEDCVPTEIIASTATSLRGAGTQDNPYIISNEFDLAYLAEQVNAGESGYAAANYIMTGDVSLYGEDWIPIGTEATPFTGVFDGGGHIIGGLYIEDSSLNNAGLFGYVQNGEIRNLGITDAYISAGSNVGGLAGNLASGTVSGSYVHGSVIGQNNVGGLVGHIGYGQSISSTYAEASVTGQNNVGGLFGSIDSGEVANSYAKGSVTGEDNVGGLVGNTGSAKIAHSFVANELTSNGSVGGIEGSDSESGNVTGSVAINPEISGENAGRITSEAEDGALSNNYAYEGILNAEGETEWAEEEAEGIDGETVSAYEIASAEFWTQTVNFSPSVWELEDNQLPMLQNLSGQNGTLGGFISFSPMSGDIPELAGTAAEFKSLFNNSSTKAIRLTANITMTASTSNTVTNSGNHYLIAGTDKTIYGNGFTLELRNNVMRMGDYNLTLVGNLDIVAGTANLVTGNAGVAVLSFPKPEANITGSARGTFTIKRAVENQFPGIVAGDTVTIKRPLDNVGYIGADVTRASNTNLINGFGEFIFESNTVFHGAARTNRVNQNDGMAQTAVIRSNVNSLFEVRSGASVTLIADHSGPSSYSFAGTATSPNTHGSTALALMRPYSTRAETTQDFIVAAGAELNVVAYGTGGIARAWSPLMLLYTSNEERTVTYGGTAPGSGVYVTDAYARANRAGSDALIEGTLNIVSNNGNGFYYNYIEANLTNTSSTFTVNGGTVNIVGARRSLTNAGISMDQWFDTPNWSARMEQVKNLAPIFTIGLDMEYATFEAYGPMNMDITVQNGGKMYIHNNGLRGMSLAGGGRANDSVQGQKKVTVTGQGSVLDVYGGLWAIAAENFSNITIEANQGGKINLASAFEAGTSSIPSSSTSTPEYVPGSTVYTVGNTTFNVIGSGSEINVEHRGGAYAAIFADGMVDRTLNINILQGGQMNASSKNSGIDHPADRATITAQTTSSSMHHWIRIDGPGSTLRVWNENTRRTNDSALYPRGAIAFAANTTGSIEVKNGGSLYARSNNQMSPTVSLGGYSGNDYGTGRLIVDQPGEIDIRNDALWTNHPSGSNTISDILNFRNPVALRSTDYIIFMYNYSDLFTQRNAVSSLRTPIQISNTLEITTWPLWQGSALRALSPLPATTQWTSTNVTGTTGSWYTNVGGAQGSNTWSLLDRHNDWREIEYFLGRNNALAGTYTGSSNTSIGTLQSESRLPNPGLRGSVSYPLHNPPNNSITNMSNLNGHAHNGVAGVDKRRNTITSRMHEGFILSDYGRIAIRGAWLPTDQKATLEMDKAVYEQPYDVNTVIASILDEHWKDETAMDTGSSALFRIMVTNASGINATGVTITDVFEFHPLDGSAAGFANGTWLNGNDPTVPFTVNAGQTAVFYFVSDSMAEEGEYVNTATINDSGTYNGGGESDTARVFVPNVEIAILKEVYADPIKDKTPDQVKDEFAVILQNLDGGKWVDAAEFLELDGRAVFMITVTNIGRRPALGVKIEDDFLSDAGQPVAGYWFNGNGEEFNPTIEPFNVPAATAGAGVPAPMPGKLVFYFVTDPLKDEGLYTNTAKLLPGGGYKISQDEGSDTATVKVTKSGGPILPDTGGDGLWRTLATIGLALTALTGVALAVINVGKVNMRRHANGAPPASRVTYRGSRFNDDDDVPKKSIWDTDKNKGG